jgi:putative heme-binding domain-containing protein
MLALWELRRDADAAVRYQLAYSLGRIDATRATASVYVQLALKDGADPYWRLAILAGVSAKACPPIFTELLEARDFRRTDYGQAMLIAWAELMAADASGEATETILRGISTAATPEPVLARGLLRALGNRGSTKTLAYLAHPNVAPGVKILTQRLLGDAVLAARDSRKPVAERTAAIRDLQLLPFMDVAGILTETLTANQPPAVQMATLETLGRFGVDEVPKMLLDAWPTFSPSVRATATEVFLSRGAWVQLFLDAVEAKTIARADVDPVRVALLQKSPVRNISARALKLFAAPAGDRQKVFTEYRPALERKGDAAKGKQLFKTHCAACHKLNGIGEEVGADLQAIRDRGMEGVLLNIIDPNREVKPQYLTYTVELKSGRHISGLITAETVTGLTIRRPDGRTEVLQRGDIEGLKSSGISFMPEGIEKQLDINAMADLLAFLASS